MTFLGLFGPVCLFDQCFHMLELHIVHVVPRISMYFRSISLALQVYWGVVRR